MDGGAQQQPTKQTNNTNDYVKTKLFFLEKPPQRMKSAGSNSFVVASLLVGLLPFPNFIYNRNGMFLIGSDIFKLACFSFCFLRRIFYFDFVSADGELFLPFPSLMDGNFVVFFFHLPRSDMWGMMGPACWPYLRVFVRNEFLIWFHLILSLSLRPFFQFYFDIFNSSLMIFFSGWKRQKKIPLDACLILLFFLFF